MAPGYPIYEEEPDDEVEEWLASFEDTPDQVYIPPAHVSSNHEPSQEPSQENVSDQQVEHRGRRMSPRRLVSNALLAAGLVLLLVAGYMWGSAQWRYHQQDKMNKQLAEHVVILDTPAEGTEQEDTGCPVDVDWEALKAVNPDVVGWIYVPNTVVNYPVYQGDSNDQYLRTNALGEYSVGGQIFLDYESTSPGMIDQQSIIYGHHLWDGTMFQPLSTLDDQEVFDATDTLWYITEEKSYELEPLFMYYVTPEDVTVRRFRFDNEARFHEYLRDKLALAVTRRPDADERVETAERVLTMSTCNYYDGYGRSILVTIEKHPNGQYIVPSS